MEDNTDRLFALQIGLERCSESTASLLGKVAHLEDRIDFLLAEGQLLLDDIKLAVERYGDGGGEVEAADTVSHGDADELS